MSRAIDIMAGLVLPDGRRWGEAAVPVQWEDAESFLDPDCPAPYQFWTRSRGYSKTEDLAGMFVADMLVDAPPGSRSYELAADRDQGTLFMDSIRGFKERTDFLQGDALKLGRFTCTTPSDAVLEILAADEAGAWGKRPRRLAVDEIAQWATTPKTKRLYEAMFTALGKSNGRMAVITSAGDPAHWSAKILDDALKDPLWRVHEVPGPPPWLDPDRLDGYRRSLPASSFARLFMNEWTAGEDRLTAMDDLAACAVLDEVLAPEFGKRYVVPLDLGIVHDRTVGAVMHAERIVRGQGEEFTKDTTAKRQETIGAKVFCDKMQVWQGSKGNPVQLRDVEEWAVQASYSYNRAPIVIDPWQAVGLAQRLRARGIRVIEFTFSSASVGRLASTLHLLLRNRAILLPREDAELLDELANVRLRETTPGVLRMDHDPDKHDDRAITLALGAVHLLERSPAAGQISSGKSIY